MRFTLLFIGLVAMVLFPFFIWGDALMNFFSEEGSIIWLTSYGQWAWLVGIFLLVADLLLPMPGTIIMAALGYIYGPVVGGLVSALGSFISGAVGYWLCRMLGEKAAIKILGKKEFERGKDISNKMGGWVVALSRWLPVFPEVVACMAGLTRMSPGKFYWALACASVPLGFTYAIIGNSGNESPMLAIGLSAGLPPVIWFFVSRYLQTRLKTTR
jgi:uncharacterized membrane protein YdjX (TVP38/TMEM64 family)